MAIDFRASQIQTGRLIGKGNAAPGGAGNKLLIYSYDSATDDEGGINFDPSPLLGTDVFLYVSGGVGSKDGTDSDVCVFGGDVFVSGNLMSEMTIVTTNVVMGSMLVAYDLPYNEPGPIIGIHHYIDLDHTLPAFVGAGGISVTYEPNGQVVIGDSGGGNAPVGMPVNPSLTGTVNVSAINYNSNGILYQHVGSAVTYAGRIWVETEGTGIAEFTIDLDSLLTLKPQDVCTGVASAVTSDILGNATTTAIITGDPSNVGEELKVTFDSLGAYEYEVGFSITFHHTDSTSGGGSGTGNSGPTRTNVGSYLITTATETVPQTAGAGYYKADEHDSTNYVFRAILSTTDPLNTAYVKLLNMSTGNFVMIGGGTIDYLSTNSQDATLLESVNLYGAANFTDDTVYQVIVYGDGTDPTTIHYNSEIVFL